MNFFAETAFWRTLQCDDTAAVVPENPSFKKARASTIEESDAKFVPVKHNFSKYNFTIPKFEAYVSKVQRWANGNAKKNRNGTFQTENELRVNGCVDPSFIKKIYLSPDARPDEYVELLLPFKKNMICGTEQISFEQMTRWDVSPRYSQSCHIELITGYVIANGGGLYYSGALVLY